MRAVALIEKQLNGVNGLVHDIAGDLTDEEWICRVLPGTNALGFSLWHMARTQDWAVQTAVRGVPEVIAADVWAELAALGQPGIGAGFTDDEANRLARTVPRAEVLAYADAVHQAVQQWLGTLSDDDLDTIPDAEAHQTRYAEYQRPSFRAEVEGLFGAPVWRFLSGPAIGHLRAHVGELELLKQVMRSRAHGG